MVWAGGHFFLLCIPPQQDRSNPLCYLNSNARVKLIAHTSTCLWYCQVLLCVLASKTCDNRPQHQTMPEVYGSCDRAGVGLSHLGIFCPRWGGSSLRVNPQKGCGPQWPQDGLVSNLASTGLLLESMSNISLHEDSSMTSTALQHSLQSPKHHHHLAKVSSQFWRTEHLPLSAARMPVSWCKCTTLFQAPQVSRGSDRGCSSCTIA